jgi:hypothetical protein
MSNFLGHAASISQELTPTLVDEQRSVEPAPVSARAAQRD